ncbi:hypothetical protein CORC01_02971 [Colletotrichum orchidophilum]|uniref:Uncharacterized protein n=1 Tax=Colletotrichum orchidophilum TaxID=1209926 RepID=A0A1G4BJW9_9PEZI|nr:uncharacterized protein CORC01_02971 [Colletotrichum orchidophilum]OHF01780.1 hypothetical protein CORC01_02971 [Colletotrichum orchidophilum]
MASPRSGTPSREAQRTQEWSSCTTNSVHFTTVTAYLSPQHLNNKPSLPANPLPSSPPSSQKQRSPDAWNITVNNWCSGNDSSAMEAVITPHRFRNSRLAPWKDLDAVNLGQHKRHGGLRDHVAEPFSSIIIIRRGALEAASLGISFSPRRHHQRYGTVGECRGGNHRHQ